MTLAKIFAVPISVGLTFLNLLITPVSVGKKLVEKVNG